MLYTSWSRELVDFAGQHLVSFAPSGVEIIRHDFLTLLGAICRYDIPRRTQEQAMIALGEAIEVARIGRSVLGPWAVQTGALYAEIRAVMLGMAFDDAFSVNYQRGPETTHRFKLPLSTSGRERCGSAGRRVAPGSYGTPGPTKGTREHIP